MSVGRIMNQSNSFTGPINHLKNKYTTLPCGQYKTIDIEKRNNRSKDKNNLKERRKNQES